MKCWPRRRWRDETPRGSYAEGVPSCSPGLARPSPYRAARAGSQRRFSICRIAELYSAELRIGPTRRRPATSGRVQLCDTAQRGEAATEGARVCDPQGLCRPRSDFTHPARQSLSTGCGSQSRAPQNLREMKQFPEILIEDNSALQRAAKHVQRLWRSSSRSKVPP